MTGANSTLPVYAEINSAALREFDRICGRDQEKPPMSQVPFAYAVVAYVHDPVMGERINCGVVVYAPDLRWFHFSGGTVGKRLGKLYPDFRREFFEGGLKELEMRAEATRKEMRNTGIWPGLDGFPGLLRGLLGDPGLSFQCSAPKFGLTDNVATTTRELLKRFVGGSPAVESVSAPAAPKRSGGDRGVWGTFQRVASKRESLKQAFHSVTLDQGGLPIKFSHAARNGALHVVQPATLDLPDSGSIARKVESLIGKAVLAEALPEIAQMIFLLRRPARQDLQPQYESAVEMLRQDDSDLVKIYEESESERLADYMEVTLSAH